MVGENNDGNKAQQPPEGNEGKKPEGEENGQSGEGNSQDKGNALEEAKKTVKDLKEENDRKEKLIERDEEVLAEKKLMGSSSYGGKPANKPVSDEEFSKKFESGEINLFDKKK